MIKVTDLEKFTLEHIVRPMQTANPEWADRKTRFEKSPITPAQAVRHSINYPVWWAMVIERIVKCGFRFPYYVNHPLVDLIEDAQKTEDGKK